MMTAWLVLLRGLNRAHIVDHTTQAVTGGVVTRCGRIGLLAEDQTGVDVASRCRHCAGAA